MSKVEDKVDLCTLFSVNKTQKKMKGGFVMRYDEAKKYVEDVEKSAKELVDGLQLIQDVLSITPNVNIDPILNKFSFDGISLREICHQERLLPQKIDELLRETRHISKNTADMLLCLKANNLLLQQQNNLLKEQIRLMQEEDEDEDS